MTHALTPAGLKPQEARIYLERLYQGAFAETTAPILVTRFDNGVVVEANFAWLKLTGFSLADILGKTIAQIGHWPDKATRHEAYALVRDTGGMRDHEAPVQTKEGQRLLVQLNCSCVDVMGELLVLTHVKDITQERLAQQALQNGEMAMESLNKKLLHQIQLFEMMEDLALVGHWTAQPGGQTIEWSQGLHRIAGSSLSGLLTLDQSRGGILAEDLPGFMAARQRMDGAVVEYRYQRPDGRVVWLRSRMHRQLDRQGVFNDFGVVQDVTAEREAALALREKLDFIEKITSQIPNVVFQYRSDRGRTGWFPFISDGVQQLLQRALPTTGEDASRLFAMALREDRPALFQSMRLAGFDGSAWGHEFRVRHRDGRIRWLLAHAVTRREADGALVSYGSINDITERKEAESRLKESEARFRSLTDLSTDWYWEIDAQFRISRFEGYEEGKSIAPQQHFLGKTHWEVGAENLNPEDWAVYRSALRAQTTFKDFEIKRLDANGRPNWISMSGAPFYDEQGKFLGYRGIARDITRRKAAEDVTQRLAFYDTLTSLPNRRLVSDRVSQAIITSERTRHHGALLFIDLDNFKDLNDTMGHDVGDQLLRQVGLRLLTCIRETDTAGRIGGDEFLILLEGLSESLALAAPQVRQMVDKLLQRLNEPYDLPGRLYTGTPSIGITVFCGADTGPEELFKRADVAMYQAKAAGRNTSRFYDPQMQAAVTARAALDSDLRLALTRSELRLHYQPQVDVHDQIIGLEALLRWQHPKRGLVMPAEIIALAEQTDLIFPIGQWVMQTACEQLVRFSQSAGTQHLTVAVNVSARQFRQVNFVRQLLDLMAYTGADPHRLKLELTETVLLSDAEDAILKMSALREVGVRFALDDFGTGYSSLSYLKRLPLDQIKIDQSFVRDLQTDPNDATIVKTILALASSLDLVAVAEGVETVAQRDFLLANGCTVFQGYLYSRPLPVNELSLKAA